VAQTVSNKKITQKEDGVEANEITQESHKPEKREE
jgi:hypothetical protein